MKKVLVYMFFCFLLFTSSAQADITTDWVNVFSDYKSYDSTYFDRDNSYAISFGWDIIGLSESEAENYTASVTFDVYTFTLELDGYNDDSGVASYWFSKSIDENDVSNWAGDYTFSFTTESYGTLSEEISRTSKELAFLDAFTVELGDEAAYWDPVEGADYYKITVLDSDNNSIGSEKIQAVEGAEEYSGGTDIPISENGDYIVKVQARRLSDDGTNFSTRSVYYTEFTITDASSVPIPGTAFLLGTGMLGLAFTSRKR
ncbi:hypothetical protein DENIS_5191 [Desulfonema ishimotonii]|uniref:PEP-CTERM protein-sorting domain-containing protein n=1 Tax=Desulfonema ishimotonii TaxID=45657 RepID=A0A401G4Q2_9BACT|nr:hypothetical protein [Desulfonema ishimotonii]GBC64173.1 hypothetical protein DENIS_5191 [Desulfonema ishimotonii]